MLRRKLKTGCTKDGVDARGEDADALCVRRRGDDNWLVRGSADDVVGSEKKVNLRALAAPDPVALHGADFFRPAFQGFKPLE